MGRVLFRWGEGCCWVVFSFFGEWRVRVVDISIEERINHGTGIISVDVFVGWLTRRSRWFFVSSR